MFGDPVDNPRGWETKGLLELGKCKNGMNFSAGESGVNVHCLGVGDFKDYSEICDTSVLPKISLNKMPPEEVMLQDGDIVFVRSNGNKMLVGRCLVIFPGDIPTTYSGFCIRFRKEAECVDTTYLVQLLKADSTRSKMAGRGANIQNLNQQILGALQIPIPPIELQQEFKDFIKQSDKSKFIGFKSQFIEMFGLPESNEHEYEIGTIADVVKDVHYGTAKKASENGRYIYIRMNNITYDGELDLADIKRIDVPEKDLAGCMVQEGDVLFNRTNSKDLVGKTCHFTGDEPMIIAGYIIRLRMNGKVLPEYVSTFMNLERSKKLLYSMAKGAVGQANINAKEVQSIPIVIPLESVQQEFLKLRKQSDKSKFESELKYYGFKENRKFY